MKKTELRVHLWPEEILKKKCKEVKAVDSCIREILEEMRSLMIESKGVGIAANQVGLDISLIVVEAKDVIFKLVNPVIVKTQGNISVIEGCLSFPGLELKIKRADKIWIKALNEKGENIVLESEGVLAVIFQHEIDHINGITFIDRISFLEKLKIHPQLKKIKDTVKHGLSK